MLDKKGVQETINPLKYQLKFEYVTFYIEINLRVIRIVTVMKIDPILDTRFYICPFVRPFIRFVLYPADSETVGT